VYWARSLVPNETKSTSDKTSLARSAAAGTSTITPTVSIPAARAIDANCLASSTVEIIGAITHGALPVCSAARAMARSWVRSRASA
jgi:hypothetical protein